MRFALSLSVLLLALIKVSFCATSYDVEVKKFLDHFSELYYNDFKAIIDSLSNAAKGDIFEAFDALDTISTQSQNIVEGVKESKQFNLNKIVDPDIKEALIKLRRIDFETYMVGNGKSQVLSSITDLNDLAKDKDIHPYSATSVTTSTSSSSEESDTHHLAYIPDIVEIIKKSKNNEELKYYWKAWRDKNDVWATVNFRRIINAFKNAAKELDIPALDYWYRFYNNPNFIEEMEMVMTEIRPFYQQLHAFVRKELVKKYGADVVDPQGPIPDHLFQQILSQAWSKDSVIESYFPFSELPSYNEYVKNMTPEEMLGHAEGFFTSLGFDPLPKTFWERYTVLQEEKDKACDFKIIDPTPIVFLQYCPKVDFRKYLQSHAYMARVFYAREKKHLPSYYFDSNDLEYPVGESVVLSASTPKHLMTIGLAKDIETTENVLLNRLFRMGLHTIFRVPMYFVHSKIMNDVINGTVELGDINEHYWNLMVEYVGVEPPMDRKNYEFDFPHEFYKYLAENGQTKKFVSEILGYQFYRAMCKKAGQHGQLHNCDFYGHKEVGDAFKSMMALGSSKPWHEVLSKVLPDEAKLSGNAMTEYYLPLLNWISKKNTEDGVTVGWAPTKKHYRRTPD